jgi:hypothetical protein
MLVRHVMVASFAGLLACCLWGCGSETESRSDEKWAAAAYLETCESSEDEVITKGDMMNASVFAALIASFGDDIIPNTAEQTACMLNSSRHTGAIHYASLNLVACLPLMAPGSLSEASDDERRYAARGQVPYTVDGEHYSMCQHDQPCKQFNEFLTNGTLKDLGAACNGPSNLDKMVKKSYFLPTTLESAAMQATKTGRSVQCYTQLTEDGKSLSIRGPVYGPIYYINMVFAYMIGGEDYVKLFPGCRVPCATSDCQDEPLEVSSKIRDQRLYEAAASSRSEAPGMRLAFAMILPVGAVLGFVGVWMRMRRSHAVNAQEQREVGQEAGLLGSDGTDASRGGRGS